MRGRPRKISVSTSIDQPLGAESNTTQVQGVAYKVHVVVAATVLAGEGEGTVNGGEVSDGRRKRGRPSLKLHSFRTDSVAAQNQGKKAPQDPDPGVIQSYAANSAPKRARGRPPK